MKKVGSSNISKHGLSDNMVNFDEDPSLPCKPCAISEDYLSQPPVFNAQGCEDQSTSLHSSPEIIARDNGIVLQKLTLSDKDSARFIGSKGSRIKPRGKKRSQQFCVWHARGQRQ